MEATQNALQRTHTRLGTTRAPAQIDDILARFSNNVRIQGQTAYIADSGSQDPTFMANALALSAGALSGSSALVVPDKIANYVGQLGLLTGGSVVCACSFVGLGWVGWVVLIGLWVAGCGGGV